MARKFTSEEGFTLLETVVAIAILAFALGALFPIFGQAPGRITYSQEKSVGIAVARSHLEEELALEDWNKLPKSGVESGWHWTVTGTRLAHSSDGEDAPGHLFRVVATASHESNRYGAPIEFARTVWRKEN